jgi:hypothetical protein
MSSHVGRKHERKESNPVRQVWKLAALPGAHSHIGSRANMTQEPVHFFYVASSAFQ